MVMLLQRPTYYISNYRANLKYFLQMKMLENSGFSFLAIVTGNRFFLIIATPCQICNINDQLLI